MFYRKYQVENFADDYGLSDYESGFVVDVDRRSSIHKSVYTSGCIFGERIARILFQVMKEGRSSRRQASRNISP